MIIESSMKFYEDSRELHDDPVDSLKILEGFMRFLDGSMKIPKGSIVF